jgi:hypothetical protein
MTAKEHNRLVGIFLMAHGTIQLVALMVIGLIYGVIGAAFTVGGQGEQKIVGVVFIAMILILGIFSLVLAVPQIVGGLKLFRERESARTWGIIGSIISCLFFPLGTAAGVYGLWFLFGDQGKQFYLSAPRPIEIQSGGPPQPGSWQ